MVVGLNVQRVRREKGFSQEELSFRSGFSRAYLSGLEAGKRNPTIMSLWKLAVALDVTLEELIQRPSKLDAKKQDGARTSRSRAKIET